MNYPLECIARGRGDQWEAICLDFDIAVQGHSLNHVTALLRETIDSYIQDAMAQPERARARLLNRRAPLRVRISWALRLFTATLRGHRLDKQREATIGFPLECHA